MMKKLFTLLAAATTLLAVSCNKENINETVSNPDAETEFISVTLNPETKTQLEGTSTVWSDGDVVSVTVEGQQVGTLEYKGENKFEGKITAGLSGAAVLNYPNKVQSVPQTQAAKAGSFANGAALLEGETTVENLREGLNVVLSNKTALLEFSTTIDGDVAFTIGNATYTVTGCKTDETYYACVDPAVSGKLSYTVGIVLGGKEKEEFTPAASKVYSLGTLALKENDIYAVVGDYSNDAWNTDTMMYETTQDNLYVAHGINFSTNGNFKIRKAGAWDDAYNFGSANTTTKVKNSAVGVFTHGSSADINVSAGTYDIYFDRLAGQAYIMEPGKSHTEATKPTAPSNTYYSLIGTLSGSNWDKDFDLIYSGDGIWNIAHKFNANEEWKVRQNHDWTNSYNNVWVGYDYKTDSNGNLKMKSEGDYIVTFVQKNQNSETNIITIAKK